MSVIVKNNMAIGEESIGGVIVGWMDVPAEVRDIIRPLIERYAYLFPRWLAELHIGFDTQNDGGAACTDAKPEYLTARILFNGAFMAGPDRFREKCVVHELCHLLNWSLHDLAHEIALKYIPDEATRAFVRDRLSGALEGSIDHLARALQRRPGEPA